MSSNELLGDGPLIETTQLLILFTNPLNAPIL